MQELVESKIKKGKKTDKEPLLSAIYLLMRKLKGHSLHDVLSLTMPQFYCLVELITQELEEVNKEYKKGRK